MVRSNRQRRWQACLAARTPRGEAASAGGFRDSISSKASGSRGFPDVITSPDAASARMSGISMEADLDSGEEAKLFSEAFRALEIQTEKRLSLRGPDLSDDDMSVLAEGDHGDLDYDDFLTKTRAGTGMYDPLSEDELQELWRQLQQRQLPSAKIARRLTEQVREHLREECAPLVRVPKPEERMIIVGDLHGHVSDFWHVYTRYGHPSPQNMYLFNGDFVDRGIWGPEVLFSLFVLRLLCPKYVFLNRGNHESEICTRFYGFQTHLSCAYPDDHQELFVMIHSAFNQLPLCHVVGEKVFVVHAGLPSYVPLLKQIEELQRGPVPHPVKCQADELFTSLLWSDPRPKTGASDRGIGQHFSPSLTNQFLQWNNLDYMVRSHECVDSGFQQSHGGMVITVFSASNYDQTNNANVVILDAAVKLVSGDQWNEAYIKTEWVEDIEKQTKEFDIEGLETSGGDFMQLEFTIEKKEGDILGVLLNAESPSMQTPVIVDIQPGLIADYNTAHPEQAVIVGDCILDLNGAAGYEKLRQEFMSTTTLHFRIRRPEIVNVTLTAAQVAALPTPQAVQCPVGGFGYTIDDWGPLKRVDRLFEVNGKRKGAEMQAALLDENLTDLDLVILRYAPKDYVLERPDEVMAQQLRQRVLSEWEDTGDSEFEAAVSAVRHRLGHLAVEGDQRERVLTQVQMMIYLNRASLLEKFQSIDKKSSPSRISLDSDSPVKDWRGNVTFEQWCIAMRTTLETGSDFPWSGLRPYLCHAEEDSDRINYVPFLLRYQNLLSRWLLKRWCEAALDKIAYKVKGRIHEKFKRLDEKGLGKLDFGTMRNFITGLIIGQSTSKVQQEYQDVLVYALFRVFSDHSPTASVSLSDFKRTLQGRPTMTSNVSPQGHALEPMQVALCCAEAFDCDDCGKEIAGDSWLCCEKEDFDLCNECVMQRSGADQIRVAAAEKASSHLEEQWARVRLLLETLSSSLLDIEDLFKTSKGKSKEVIDKAAFMDGVRIIFIDDPDAPEEVFKCVCEYLTDEQALEITKVPTMQEELEISKAMKVVQDAEQPGFVKKERTLQQGINEARAKKFLKDHGKLREKFSLKELVSCMKVQDTTTSLWRLSERDGELPVYVQRVTLRQA